LSEVRSSDGHIIEWNRERIVKQLVEETKLVGIFYGKDGIDNEYAQSIAKKSNSTFSAWDSNTSVDL
jgi:ribonucleoside-triphosphate reductase